MQLKCQLGKLTVSEKCWCFSCGQMWWQIEISREKGDEKNPPHFENILIKHDRVKFVPMLAASATAAANWKMLFPFKCSNK